jgi:hypothetical protein
VHHGICHVIGFLFVRVPGRADDEARLARGSRLLHDMRQLMCQQAAT